MKFSFRVRMTILVICFLGFFGFIFLVGDSLTKEKVIKINQEITQIQSLSTEEAKQIALQKLIKRKADLQAQILFKKRW